MGENINNKKEMSNMSKTILELNNEKQKLLNENKLLENNLEQARQKLLDEMNSKEELIKKYRAKGNEDKELENKLKDLQNKYEQLQEELSIEKSNNSFNEMNNKNLLEEINKLKNNKRWNKVNHIKPYAAVVLIKGKTKIINKINKYSPEKLKIKREVNKVFITNPLLKTKIKKFDVESFDLIGEIQLDIINKNNNKNADKDNDNNFNKKNKIQSSVNTIIRLPSSSVSVLYASFEGGGFLLNTILAISSFSSNLWIRSQRYHLVFFKSSTPFFFLHLHKYLIQFPVSNASMPFNSEMASAIASMHSILPD